MTNIKLPDKRLGYYHLNGKQYVSVTQILEILSKPALVPWAIRMTAQAIADNPDIIKNEKDVISAVYGKRDKAGERGRTLHSLLEVLKNNNPLPQVPDDYKGYADALKSWWETYKPINIKLERIVFSDKFGFAGSEDLNCDIGNVNQGIDLKTGKAIYKEAYIQRSTYSRAEKTFTKDKKILDNKFPEKSAILLLKEDGNFVFEEIKEVDKYFKLFLHAKSLWEGLNEPR